MNIELLKQLGNIDQIAGIRQTKLLHGRGEGIQLAEFYNAAGLRFTLVPDRCMDIYDLSYKGMNLSFQSKNGLTSPQAFNAMDGEFAEQWPGGALVTCGLDNVGIHAVNGGVYPTHGRISHTPAKNFGTNTYWDGDNYVLKAAGEVHQTKMYSRHLSLRRCVETGLNEKSIRIHDVITNFEAEDEPYMMLYHFNFGYPLLQADSRVAVSKASTETLTELTTGYRQMIAPEDGRGEELYFHSSLGDRAVGVLYNMRLGLGAYVAFDTKNLPDLIQWKMMKSHDYVLALEPCNTCGINRDEAVEQNKIAVLPGYSSVENHLELGVLDGREEIEIFLATL